MWNVFVVEEVFCATSSHIGLCQKPAPFDIRLKKAERRRV
jgi:hypothetical protein